MAETTVHIAEVNGDGVPKPSGKVSYEEFLEWADEDTHAEWVDGEIIMTSPASYKHQLLMSFLEHLVSRFAEVHDLGGVILPPFQMKLARSGREPDLLFIKKERQPLIQNTFLQGPADLVVEIISPESRKRDTQTKLAEYAEGKVPEYWVIDTLKNEVRFYQLDQAGKYRKQTLDSEGKYYSQVLAGFWFKESWLWQEPLPSEDDVLLEIAGPAYAQYLLDKLRQKGFLP